MWRSIGRNTARPSQTCQVILYRVLYRMVGRFSHTSTSDYAEIGRPDTPDAPDTEEDEDLPAYPGVEVPTITVADES
jgi:hypothetical protein